MNEATLFSLLFFLFCGWYNYFIKLWVICIKTMIILITGASHTGKTALAQKHNANYILIEDKYEINID